MKARFAQFRNEVAMKPVPPWSAPGSIVYPESDGERIAENTRQFRWIMLLHGNLSALFDERPDVFVAADLFWYPVEGHPEIRTAPDGLVVFGRPQGDRGSYRQWEEDNIPVTVAFEVLGPTMTAEVQSWKREFYTRHGVEEYYVYDPEGITLEAYLRRGDALVEIAEVDGFVSPRLGIRFDLSGKEMVVVGPDGRPFLSFVETRAACEQAEQRILRAQEATKRYNRIAELIGKVVRQQASQEELRELKQLEDEASSRR
jgi:Uma2 family endonuclease